MNQSKKAAAVSFNEYKLLKDEIIEISEQRFENILTRRLAEFKKAIIDEIDIRLKAITAQSDAKFEAIDARFNSLKKRISFLTWFLPVFITLLMVALRVYGK